MSTLNFFTPYDDFLIVENETYEIDMRMKNVMRFIDLSQDDAVSDAFRMEKGLALMLFGNKLSEYSVEVRVRAYISIVKHIQGRIPEPPKDRKGNPLPIINNDVVTDFKQDFDYIFASFMQVYKIDLLDNRDMHYHKYKAMLHALPDDSIYKTVIRIRGMSTEGYKGEDLAKLMELKSFYALREGG